MEEKLCMVNVDELKPHPRNEEFFDNLSGERWRDFKKSISENGVIEPVVITDDNIIISGHQRIRACKELGIPQVVCCQKHYDTEDQVLRDLIEANIRQRGDVGGSARKVGRRVVELERIYGIRRGRPQAPQNPEEKNPNNSAIKTQKDLAELFGMSVDTINNYKVLAHMPPELEKLLDAGIISSTTAQIVMKELPPEDQKMFIWLLPDVKKISGKKAKELIEEYKLLRGGLGLNGVNYLSPAEQGAQQFAKATREYIMRFVGNIGFLNEWRSMDSALKEDLVGVLNSLAEFTNQVLRAWMQAPDETATDAPEPIEED